MARRRPRPIHGAIVDQLQLISDAGQPAIPDVDLAAHQLVALTSGRARAQPLS